MKPAKAAPRMGATQNSHSCPADAPSAKIAVAVERAGFTPPRVIGVAIWMASAKASPIAIGAKPLGARASVAPRMTATKTAATMNSTISAAAVPKLGLVPSFQTFETPLNSLRAVSYTHLRAHETRHDLVCR